jgi:hypothetical protein
MLRSLGRLLGFDRYRKRYQIINHFIRTRGYRRYLEIGVSSGRSIARTRCADRVGVDPEPRTEAHGFALHAKTSDEFFRDNTSTFDIVFIDGLHLAEQVLRDVLNSLAVLNANGIVLLHDCNPLSEEVQFREQPRGAKQGWSGDVWKAIVYIRRCVPQVYCRVLDTDQGIGVVVPLTGRQLPECSDEIERDAARCFAEMTWQGLLESRVEWLGIVDSLPALEAELRREGICIPG